MDNLCEKRRVHIEIVITPTTAGVMTEEKYLAMPLLISLIMVG